MDNFLHEYLVFEKEERLFERKYSGVPYWQSTRVDISRKLQNQDTGIAESKTHEKKRIFRVMKRIQGICYDYINWFYLKHADILHFDEQMSRIVDGKVVNVYFDYWNFFTAIYCKTVWSWVYY